jgi:dihydropteroate synthase
MAASSLRHLPPRGPTHVMAVLNLTPDSFSDGGRFVAGAPGRERVDADAALAAAVRLVAGGAAVLDVGAVSTRPGSEAPPTEVEWARLEPVLRGLRAAVPVPISLDTTRAAILGRALELGVVDLLNDVSALQDDPDMAPLAASAGLPVILMHRRGAPRSMQQAPHYDDAPREVLAELQAAARRAQAAGIAPAGILLDPGLGFGKRVQDNVALLAALPRLVALGHRTVLGASRKSFLGALTGRETGDREHATTAVTVLAALAGVDFVRAHDVAAARDALTVVRAVRLAR